MCVESTAGEKKGGGRADAFLLRNSISVLVIFYRIPC